MAGDFPNLDATIIAQWPKPNDFNPTTRSWLPVYSATLAVVSTFAICARIWRQAKRSTKGLGLDDWLMCAAWAFAIFYTALLMRGELNFGFDRHIWDVSSTLYSSAALTQWLSEGTFTIGMALIRISVLSFYRRLETPCTGTFRKIIYALMIFTACYTIACLMTLLLLCRPISAYWTILGRNGERKCSSQTVYYLFNGILDITATLYTILVPLLALSNLPMSQLHRNALRVFAITSFSVVGAAIARAVYLFRLADSKNGDATWNGFNVFVCSALEFQLAIFFASLPYLRSYLVPNTSVPIVLYANTKHESPAPKTTSSVAETKRPSLSRVASTRNGSIASVSKIRPLAVEIPEWEFAMLDTPRYAGSCASPMSEVSYEQYARGQWGPPAPPKDSQAMFDQYRREHGEVI